MNGVRSGDLNLVGLAGTRHKRIPSHGMEWDQPTVRLHDMSQLYEPKHAVYTGEGKDFRQSAEQAFIDLCKSYPPGRVSVVMEQLDAKGGKTGKTLGFQLHTGTAWKDAKEVVWDSRVQLVVNLAGAAAAIFIPRRRRGDRDGARHRVQRHRHDRQPGRAGTQRSGDVGRTASRRRSRSASMSCRSPESSRRSASSGSPRCSRSTPPRWRPTSSCSPTRACSRSARCATSTSPRSRGCSRRSTASARSTTRIRASPASSASSTRRSRSRAP